MEDLVKAAKSGNKEAFTHLMILLEDDLYKIAKIRLKNDDDILEVVQETTISAFKSIKKLKEIKYFKTWLIRILISKSNDICRKNKRNSLIISLDEVNENVRSPVYPNLEDTDTLLDFSFMCKNLKDDDRLIIILYYMEKFTDKEIGNILKLKESTVTTKRTRAKQKIKKILEIGENQNG